MTIPHAWATDIEVLRLSGAVIDAHPDHVVITSPRNPGYHWGNFVLVTDPDAADDAARWVSVFDEHCPGAGHISIGLPREPDPAGYRAAGLTVEAELVLDTGAPVTGAACPSGYVVRALEDADWAGVVAADLQEMIAEGRPGDAGDRAFVERRVETRADLARRSAAVFLGAFAGDGGLAAQLGIVLCGAIGEAHQVARYQHVSTVPGHRGRGLASHLLGVAGRWAADRGADRWEIHVDPGSGAHRLYDRLGFRERALLWQAHGEDPVSRP
jgi:GNAT superfamily N-acetyltransferase